MLKCEFFKPKVEFLGYVVSKNGLAMDPHKVDAILNWPEPKNLHELRSFLGLGNYYRKFIQHYAKITTPLTLLLKDGQPFKIDIDQKEALATLKTAFTSAPVLTIADPELPFTITTDASGHAIGAVLSQNQRKGDQPIAFESRKMTPAERNYPVHEQELLAIMHALKVWHIYLEGHPFTIITDHASLTYLDNQQTLSR